MAFTTATLLLAAFIFLCQSQSINTQDESGGETGTEVILGSATATPGQFPFVVALFYDDRFICVGSIISNRTILTAAHCVVSDGKPQPAGLLHAVANISKSASTVKINFESITPHKEYDEVTLENDIAVLTTIEEIQFSDEVGPVCLPRPSIQLKMNEKAIIMGWENISPAPDWNFFLEDKLQYKGQYIVNNSVCVYVTLYLNEKMICALPEFLTRGACEGDGGGPLVIQRQGRLVQIGISSYGEEFGCRIGTLGVYTRVSSFYDDILQMAGDQHNCTV